jgi:hypothetical protein
MSLPQLVPSRICLKCDVCCRFPEPDSFLRPYFTPEEKRKAVARGVDPAHFPGPAGGQVSVVPNPSGDAYLCPAFDPATSHCRIYEDRPLDCQIYPLAVMWNDTRSQVVLGWDAKCPFMREAVPSEIRAHAKTVAALVEREDMLETFVGHPRLIGRFQDDVVVLHPLPRLTARMKERFEVRGSKFEAGPPRTPYPVPRALHPFRLADRSRFAQAFARVDTELAHYALAPHLIWRSLFDYSWAELDGHLCLFAGYADGIYMPLPPLPENVSRAGGGPAPARGAVEAAFALMRAHNRGSAVSRIENVPEEWGARLEAMGYRVTRKDPDYLYRAADLVALAGDRYKSQRAACNRFEREHRQAFGPYRGEDREACLALFRDWSAQKQAAGLGDEGRHMLGDAEAAHREALTHHRELGLTGSVVRVEGRIRAYTFGYARSPSVWCVLLEVADRTVPGLAAFIFRECCREAAGRGCEFVNAMDDAGLPSLGRSKQAYHPVRLVPSCIVSER